MAAGGGVLVEVGRGVWVGGTDVLVGVPVGGAWVSVPVAIAASVGLGVPVGWPSRSVWASRSEPP